VFALRIRSGWAATRAICLVMALVWARTLTRPLAPLRLTLRLMSPHGETSAEELLESIATAGRVGLNSSHPVPPETLYHFSDAAGLAGIVRNRVLWATVASGMNDSSELQYGLRVVHDCLANTHIASGDFRVDVDQLLDQPIELPGTGPTRPFVVSFCERDDLAVHWLHYGRLGLGCALAFAATRLPGEPLCNLRKVHYSPAQRRQAIETVLGTIWTAYAKLDIPPAVAALVQEYAATWAAWALREVALCIKHPSFADEREWRLITNETIAEVDASHTGGTNVDLDFRSSSGRIVPYLKMPLDPGTLKEVVLGGSFPQHPDDEAFLYLRERSLLGPFEIRRSTVPVRP
jgi:hypothetical protein